MKITVAITLFAALFTAAGCQECQIMHGKVIAFSEGKFWEGSVPGGPTVTIQLDNGTIVTRGWRLPVGHELSVEVCQ